MSGKGQIATRVSLGEFFGVALTTVDSWVRSGAPVVQRGSRGKEWKFNTAEVAAWLQLRAREEASGDALVDERELKRRKLAAETERAELELAKARGEVAPIREMERVWAAQDAATRSNIMNVPGRAVLQLLGCTDETEFKEKLRAELVLALETAAETDLDVPEDEPIED